MRISRCAAMAARSSRRRRSAISRSSQLLVERGADVNGFVLSDETPLINAAREGNLDVVRYLVAHGADINLAVPAEAGPAPEIRSPLSEALKHGRTQVVDYLRAHGAQR